MKKIILSMLMPTLALTASAVEYMNVKTTDGKVTYYDLENVEKVNYETDQSTSTRYMNVFTSDNATDKFEVENVKEVFHNDYIMSVSGQVDGYDYVDLGLPSGLKWATCNVGTSYTESYGDFFSWGETTPKKNYHYNQYFLEDWSWSDLVSKGIINSQNVLNSQYDAATYNWGPNWRMPRYEEFQELIDNCEVVWDTLNGVAGCKFVSQYNDNWIFLPAAGWYNASYHDSMGEYGRYRVSNTDGSYNWKWEMTTTISIAPVSLCTLTSSQGFNGFSVRPVSGEYIKSKPRFEVCFYSPDSILIEKQLVIEGEDAVAPDMPAIEGYEFAGWSQSYKYVWTKMSIYATYRKVENPEIDGHSYVDLGLPSGLKWATCNIGASKPEDDGDYFAWGETTKKEKYFQDNSLTYNKENDGFVSSEGNLAATYDVATQTWGSSWRMPTREDYQELYNNCDFSTLIINGVEGYKIKSRQEGNDNWIFIPISGYYYNANVLSKGWSGYYWSSTAKDEKTAYVSRFSDLNIVTYSSDKYQGCTVRPVSE
ncbi:MAG: hypothetical protein MJZ19_09130 [Paludibacteraceae bacterium]|nr:hypothetical protein [Paludibacteraceae bacterium]